MSWTSVELEYVCPFCNNVVVTNTNTFITDIGDGIGHYLVDEYCTVCNASMALPGSMVITRVSIPVRDNFGASIF